MPSVTLSNPGTQNSYNGDSVGLLLLASDSAGNTLNFTAANLPSGISINATSAFGPFDFVSIGGTISPTASGPYFATVTATDPITDESATQAFTWNVSQPTVTLTPLSDQNNYDGDAVSLPVHASENDFHLLNYSASGLPTGLSINAVTGVISGTIASDADAGGPYSVTVTATDSAASVSASQTFSWAVAQPTIALANPGDQSNYDGDAVSLGISASEDAGHALTYSATGLPAGLSISSSTGVISGTVANDADASGPYSVTVSAADSAGGVSASQTFSWAVAQPTVTVANPLDQDNLDADSVSFGILATDTASHSLSYSASGLPSGISINSSTGVISGTIGITADADSPYSVTVSASDSAAGVSASQTFHWCVHTPTTYDGSLSTTPNTAITEIDLTQDSNEPDDPSMAVVIVSGPSNGLLTQNDDGTYTFTPNTGFTGTDSFTFDVVVGDPATSNTSTVTVTVAADVPSTPANSDGGTEANNYMSLGWPNGISPDAASRGDSSLFPVAYGMEAAPLDIFAATEVGGALAQPTADPAPPGTPSALVDTNAYSQTDGVAEVGHGAEIGAANPPEDAPIPSWWKEDTTGTSAPPIITIFSTDPNQTGETEALGHDCGLSTGP